MKIIYFCFAYCCVVFFRVLFTNSFVFTCFQFMIIMMTVVTLFYWQYVCCSHAFFLFMITCDFFFNHFVRRFRVVYFQMDYDFLFISFNNRFWSWQFIDFYVEMIMRVFFFNFVNFYFVHVFIIDRHICHAKCINSFFDFYWITYIFYSSRVFFMNFFIWMNLMTIWTSSLYNFVISMIFWMFVLILFVKL